MMTKQFLTASAVTMVTLASFGANAEDLPGPRVHLRWDLAAGAEACISAAELVSAVESRLEQPVFTSEAEADLLIEGRIEATSEVVGYRGLIVTRRKDGSRLGNRELRSDGHDCRKLDGALALAIALTIDPDPVTRAEPPPPVITRTPPAMTVELPGHSPRPWRFGGDLSAVMGFGILPSADVGLRAELTVQPPRWPAIEIGGSVWLERETRTDTRGARLSLWTVGASLCPLTYRRQSVSLGGCVGAQAGQLRAEGIGFDENQRRSEAIAYGVGSSRLDVPLAGTASLRIAAAMWIPFARPRFFYEDSSAVRHDVYQPPHLAGVLALGLHAAF